MQQLWMDQICWSQACWVSRFHPTVGLGEKGSFVKMNTFTLQIPYKMAIYECEEQDLLDTFQIPSKTGMNVKMKTFRRPHL